MKKIREYMGAFDRINCCTKCDWFQRRGFLVPPRVVCPECGSDLQSEVGQYRIKETKNLFSKETECIAFIRK